MRYELVWHTSRNVMARINTTDVLSDIYSYLIGLGVVLLVGICLERFSSSD